MVSTLHYQGGKNRISDELSEIMGGNSNLKYQGGKSRLANDLSKIMRGGQRGNQFISLFCGACSIESKIKGYDNIICNDNHPYLIALLQALQNGYELPEEITEEQYHYIKEHKDEDPALTGFVGFACSFGGKWFGGYARDKDHVNYAARGKRTLMSKMTTLMDAQFTCLDYRDVILPDGCTIYCDPPYDNTTKYANKKFDTTQFWEYMRKISQDHLVYISELKAPDDFVSIWQKDVKRILDVNKSNQFKSTEKLFVHKNNLPIIQNNYCNTHGM